jgi:hypothetical protein
MTGDQTISPKPKTIWQIMIKASACDLITPAIASAIQAAAQRSAAIAIDLRRSTFSIRFTNQS